MGQVKCLLYLLSSLGIALPVHAIIGTLYLLIIQSSSASSLKILKYHISNQPDLYPFLIGALYISIIAIVHSLIA